MERVTLKHIILQDTEKKVGVFHLEKLHLSQNCTDPAEEAALTLVAELADMFKQHSLAVAALH
jgi:hypothetical protein